MFCFLIHFAKHAPSLVVAFTHIDQEKAWLCSSTPAVGTDKATLLHLKARGYFAQFSLLGFAMDYRCLFVGVVLLFSKELKSMEETKPPL